MDEVTILPHLTTLGIAYPLAIPIAWDREKEDRSAGLRTFPLVAIATCGFIEGTENFLRGSPEAQARVIEGLITGVGFIGGGAILRQRASVHGTATAASLWATGAVGVASALDAYEVAGLIAGYRPELDRADWAGLKAAAGHGLADSRGFSTRRRLVAVGREL
jgi:putative Mg2+ transporter-C (MgtC) family protein